MSHPTSPGHPGPGYLAVTRSAYDTVAADYADLLRDELAGRPLDRALLAAFADLVRPAGQARWLRTSVSRPARKSRSASLPVRARASS